jgi:NodT family efflux transporter outer membrane factor (OMF) lipoprotein
MHYILQSLRLIAIIWLSMAITGCMVGPSFHSPRAPDTQRYTHTSLPNRTIATPKAGNAGKIQDIAMNEDIPSQWWTLFHSQEINHLIQQGLDKSPTLIAAKATLVEAEETLNAQIGSLLLPAVDLGLGGNRERSSGLSFDSTNPSSIFNLYNTTAKITYPLDVFGGSRRQVESYRAQVDYERYQLIAAYLTLTSNIVTTAITIASVQEQIAATAQLIREESKTLYIIKKQFQLGGVSNANVLSQQSQLATTQALLPPLQKNLAQSRHALAVLIGDLPSESPTPILHLDRLILPKELPVSLPSNLVRQRPDIQAADATLHSASAQIGVATANLFPQINITGNYGWLAQSPGSLFTPLNKTWFYGLDFTQPLFHGGSLLAQRRAAIAAYEAAYAQYQQTVLQAFQNVADSLRAIEYDANELNAQTDARTAAYATLSLTRDQYQLGAADYLSLLTAEQQYQSAMIKQIQAAAARYADTVALFQALGGGWWNNCKPIERKSL